MAKSVDLCFCFLILGKKVVIKVLKQHHNRKWRQQARNELRSIRESILLQYISNNNLYVIQELGHCLHKADYEKKFQNCMTPYPIV